MEIDGRYGDIKQTGRTVPDPDSLLRNVNHPLFLKRGLKYKSLFLFVPPISFLAINVSTDNRYLFKLLAASRLDRRE
jgi:hypothetical protein